MLKIKYIHVSLASPGGNYATEKLWLYVVLMHLPLWDKAVATTILFLISTFKKSFFFNS